MHWLNLVGYTQQLHQVQHRNSQSLSYCREGELSVLPGSWCLVKSQDGFLTNVESLPEYRQGGIISLRQEESLLLVDTGPLCGTF
jgi:hypothetical protein